jgi:amidohydrolase
MNIKILTEEIESQIIEIRRKLHRDPELSLREFKTTNLIYETLKSTSIELKKCSNGTGVIGLLRGKEKGKTLAIRADIDALPIMEETGLPFTSENGGIMHACGHDIHTSVLLGTAIVLDKFKDSIKGNIKFIFQPAEETMQGAKLLIEEGVLNEPKVDNIICLHCWPYTDAGKIGVRHGPIMAAAERFEIEVQGIGGHAAHPHKAIDPIPIAAQIISGLQHIVARTLSPLESAVVTIGQIHGGNADNIIANSVKISGTVRSLTPEVSKKIQETMIAISENTAKAFKGSAKVNYITGSPPVINNEELVDLLSEVVKENLGEDNFEYLPEPSLGGEDFSFYLQHVEGMLFRLGTRSETEATHKSLHNPGVIFDEKSISTGIVTMSAFALKYLN